MKGSLPPPFPFLRHCKVVPWYSSMHTIFKDERTQATRQIPNDAREKRKKRKEKESWGRWLLESHEIRSNWYLICRNSWFGARIFAILKLGGYKIAIQWFARNCKKYIIHKTICYLRFPNFSSRPAVLAARRSHCPNLATKIFESSGFDAPTIHAHCTLS